VCYPGDCTQEFDECGSVTNNCWAVCQCSGVPPTLSASVGYFTDCSACSGGVCQCYSGYVSVSGCSCTSSSSPPPPFDINITYDSLEANPTPYNSSTNCDCNGGFVGCTGECDSSVEDECGVCGGNGSTCDGTLLVPSEYSTIQSAINAASEGDSVLVQPGTYYENIIWPETNGIKLIGSGVETCSIDGNQQANVIRFKEDLGGIIDSTTLITGFTIQNGHAQGGNMVNSGGGMNLYKSSPTLTDVTFSGNTADNCGGGMYLHISNPTLTGVTFSGNTGNGGGMCIITHSSPTLTDVTFSDNTATYAGGMGLGYSNPNLTGVTFSGNTADNCGGMCLEFSSPTLTDVTFSDNTATYAGGMGLGYSNPNLTGVTFSGNTADNCGGMCLEFSSPTLTNSIVWGNSPQEIYFRGIGGPNSITITYSDIQSGEVGIVTNDNGTVY
jgi:parallel beta-helix repeat protein